MMRSLTTCLSVGFLISLLLIASASADSLHASGGLRQTSQSDPQHQQQQQQQQAFPRRRLKTEIYIGAPGTYFDFSKPQGPPPTPAPVPAAAPAPAPAITNNATSTTIDNTDDFIPEAPPASAVAEDEDDPDHLVVVPTQTKPLQDHMHTEGILVGYRDDEGHNHANPGMELPAYFQDASKDTNDNTSDPPPPAHKSVQLQVWHRIMLVVLCLALLVTLRSVYLRCCGGGGGSQKRFIMCYTLKAKCHKDDDDDTTLTASSSTDEEVSVAECSDHKRTSYTYGDGDEDWNGPMPRRRGTLVLV